MYCLQGVMWSTIRTKLCCSSLLLIVLLSVTTTTMAIFTDKDCVEINANNTQCECFIKSNYYLIQCPAKVSQIKMKISILYVQVKIEHNVIDGDLYKLLPAMDIGILDELYLSQYQFSSEPIINLLNHLGITKTDLIYITLSDHLKDNITRERLSGLTNLGGLVIYNIDLSHASEDIFADLPNLTWLSLSSANLQFKPSFFDSTADATVPKFNSKKLEQLPAGIFRNQYKLEKLHITFSQLQKISKVLFQATTSLTILNLNNNTIESIQFDVFSSLANLEEINLDENYLQELPPKIFSYNEKLTKVLIRDNHVPIKSLPSGMLTNLKNLRLVNITYGNVLNSVYDVSETETILIISCGLIYIPSNFFANSTKFTKISLANNELITVDENLLVDQFHLNYLDLSHNKLQSMPDGIFRDSVYLYDLRLSYNQLTEISSGIFSPISRLWVLYMDNNRLKTISPDAFVQTTSLTFIYMENNFLNLVDPPSSQKDNLKHKLNSPFQFLESLHTLNLRNNTLSNIFSDWHKMEVLKVLDLSYNKITSLDSSDLLFHSNNELSINLNHNRIRKINFHNITKLTDSLNKTIRLQLNNNPFNCDCNLLPFVQYVHGTPHIKLNLTIDELVCDKPENMKKSYVRNVDPKELLCPFDFKNFEPPHCPNKCSCWERTFGSVLMVNCSRKHLKDVPTLPRVKPLALKSIELHIENNALCKLPTVSTTGYADVTEIYAAGNNLSQIDLNNLPQNLTYLDLTSNKFTELNDKVIHFFNQSSLPRKVALSENPWHCDCKSKPLLAFVTNSHNSNTTIPDVKNVYCATPINYKMTDYLLYKDICQEEQFVTNAFLGTIAFAGFSIGLIIALLYYKFQIEIKVWLYKYRICSCCVNEDELDRDKTYDAFISYSHKDEDFIAEHLVPQLEEGPIRFKLCVHVRDFVIGECIPDQIVRSIDNSKRTIIVLSENFINSAWAQLEFRQAHQAGLNEGRARLIVILYGKIGDIKALDKDLQAYLSTTTYLEWGNPWFWDKLRYAMPHPSKKLNNLVQHPLRCNEDDNIELNEIPME